MKKSRQPLKRTELKRHTPLRSKTSISNGPVKPRKPGPMPKDEKRCRELLKVRSCGLCETQVAGHCTRQATVVSHRKRRSQSGPAEKWSPTNTLRSCLPCELYLTQFGSTARVRGYGWTVHPTVNPASVPVYRNGVWVWLLENGSFELLDLMEIAEWVKAA